jgi:hypothetical protein
VPAWIENRRYGRKLADVVVQQPLFVLGHWRNGTTHLHNLLTVDKRFAFPNIYQSLYPHSFLTTEAVNSRAVGFFLPRRRPMDNVEWTMQSPQEDEFALCIWSFKSPCMGWAFPRQREHYDRYLTFRHASNEEIAAWQEALMMLLKKLTLKYARPLVLKSPPHTCRIKLVRQMFPQAKFVHIHRNPFDVFQSSRRTFQLNFELHRLQRARLDDLDDWILRQFREMYDVFFEERTSVPAGHFHEVCYEDLERDPLGEVGRIYESLNLPAFSQVEPALRRYIDSISHYKKNEFPALPGDLRNRIAHEWRPCFQEWGYATG